MTTIQELSIYELFEIRDALQVLDKYNYAPPSLMFLVQQAIAEFRDRDNR